MSEEINGIDVDEFVSAYIQCALWSSTYGEDGEGRMDDGEHELSAETRETMRNDCATFLSRHGALITEDAYKGGASGGHVQQAGHDFWLTRCGHGAGFWDGDWHEPNATELTKACEAFGNVDLYVGDDGAIHQM